MRPTCCVLQASGEAIYTSDIVMPPSGLYGVFVESTEALAELQGVDPGPALALPGVAAYIDVADIPKGGANLLNTCGTDIIFADARVEYVGQRIGMVLADSQVLSLNPNPKHKPMMGAEGRVSLTRVLALQHLCSNSWCC